MAITFRAATALTASTDIATPFANITWTLPTGAVANDLLIAGYAAKNFAAIPNGPTGYTLANAGANGTVATGVGAGSVYVAGYYKNHSGTESAPSSTMSFPYALAMRGMIALTKSTANAWGVAGTMGYDRDASGSTNAFDATGSNVLPYTTGDWIVAIVGHNDDSSSTTFAANALSVPGCVVGTSTQRLTGTLTTLTGDDGRMYIVTASITSGTATGLPRIIGTTGNNDSDGTVLFMIVRDSGVAIQVGETEAWGQVLC